MCRETETERKRKRETGRERRGNGQVEWELRRPITVHSAESGPGLSISPILR